VILPLTVLRRLDCVLAPTKADVFEKYLKYKDRLDNLTPMLTAASGFAFYNTSKYSIVRTVFT
jgi:type I restriction enzyme M protein